MDTMNASALEQFLRELVRDADDITVEFDNAHSLSGNGSFSSSSFRYGSSRRGNRGGDTTLCLNSSSASLSFPLDDDDDEDEEDEFPMDDGSSRWESIPTRNLNGSHSSLTTHLTATSSTPTTSSVKSDLSLDGSSASLPEFSALREKRHTLPRRPRRQLSNK